MGEKPERGLSGSFGRARSSSGVHLSCQVVFGVVTTTRAKLEQHKAGRFPFFYVPPRSREFGLHSVSIFARSPCARFLFASLPPPPFCEVLVFGSPDLVVLFRRSAVMSQLPLEFLVSHRVFRRGRLDGDVGAMSGLLSTPPESRRVESGSSAREHVCWVTWSAQLVCVVGLR